MAMDSRMSHLVFQTLNKKNQMGSLSYGPGAHMYHAATGVSDGKTTKKKEHANRKAFARLRAVQKEKYDQGTHSYTLSTKPRGDTSV